MNIIIDELTTILRNRIGSIEFNTDFRVSILFEMLMQDKTIKNKDKVAQSLRLYYPKIEQITNFGKAIEDMLWFYKCGKEELANSNNKNSKEKHNTFNFA